MSFAKAKIRRFYEINNENKLPGPGHYDPYKKSDYRAKPTLKTINSHAKKNAKKTRVKLASVLRERVNNSVTKQELLNLANEGIQNAEETEIQVETNSKDIDDNSHLQNILNEKIAEIAIQTESYIDKLVQKAASMDAHYINIVNMKNLEIEELKQQLSCLQSVIGINCADKDEKIVKVKRNEQEKIMGPHLHV